MIDKKYLPSKKFTLSLLFALFFIIIAVILNYWKPNKTNYNKNIDEEIASAITELDTDKDNLPDWKEALYGTDTKKSDTDEDGTSDYDEILANRDPLKANTSLKDQEPNDKLEKEILEKSQQIIDEYEKLSDVEKISRTIFSDIIASQPISGEMDQETINSIISKTISNIPQYTYGGITKIEDLNLQQTDDSNLNKNLTEYKNSYYKETEVLRTFLGTEINIINKHISNPSSKDLSDMKKITDKYKEIINNLIEMPVPVAIGYYDVNYHLSIINNLEKIVAINENIVSEENFLGIFSNLSNYNTAIKQLTSTLSIIDSVLKITR